MSKREEIIKNKTIKRIVFIELSYFYIAPSIVANKYYLLNEIFAVSMINYFSKKFILFTKISIH